MKSIVFLLLLSQLVMVQKGTHAVTPQGQRKENNMTSASQRNNSKYWSKTAKTTDLRSDQVEIYY